MKRFLAALLCIAMCFMLTGCMTFGVPLLAGFLEGVAEELEEAANQSSEADAPLFEVPEWLDDARENYDPETAEWGEGNPEGSAVLLDGRTVVVTLYLEDGGTPWATEDKSFSMYFLTMAADYIEEEAAAYGAEAELVVGEEGTVFDAHINGINMYDSDKVWDNNARINDWIEKNIDCDAMMDMFAADGIAFIVMINGSGISYTLPYYASEYIDEEGFLEKSMIYLRAEDFNDDYEAPAVYAHEMLHLFGAVDLYEECEEDGVTADLVRYAEAVYPYDIMLHTFLADGSVSYTEIPQSMSPVTAYTLGLTDDIPELDMFPELERPFPGSFWYGEDAAS